MNKQLSIVVVDTSRSVPTGTQGLVNEIDVAHFGSRYVSTYTAKIRHQSRPVEPRGDGSVDVKDIVIQKVRRVLRLFDSFINGSKKNQNQQKTCPRCGIDLLLLRKGQTVVIDGEMYCDICTDSIKNMY